MKIEAVLLDMGGVLLDFKGTHAVPFGRLDFRGRMALLEVLEREGGSLSLEALDEVLFSPWREGWEERYRTMREAPWEPHLARLRSRAGVSAGDLALLGAWFEPYRETVQPCPGAAAALGELAAQAYALALVSNVPLPGALYWSLLAEYGLAEPFASVHFSYDEGSRKPSPRMLHSALSELGCPPERAVMVGDLPSSDVAAGRAAGTATVWIRGGRKHGGHPRGPEADAAIDSLADLPALLATWGGG